MAAQIRKEVARFHRFIVGVMGGSGSDLPRETLNTAYRLGELIAGKNWVLLCGGRPRGVMEASAAGAKKAGGLTVGILPGKEKARASEQIDLVIVTGMGDGRNYINILSSDIVVALPGRAGTIAEIALALKNGKEVILLNFDPGNTFDYYKNKGLLRAASTPEEVIQLIQEFFNRRRVQQNKPAPKG